MSECFPHFFCDTCSNVIHRESDKRLVWNEKSQEILDEIAKTLPKCSCGGQFSPNCGPKCKHCNTQIPVVRNAIEYLHNPNMIVADGACTFSDRRDPYMVRIIDDNTQQHNKTIKTEKISWLRQIAKFFRLS